MKKLYDVFLIECVTLKKKLVDSITAESLEEAKTIGTNRHSKSNHFVGVQPRKNS